MYGVFFVPTFIRTLMVVTGDRWQVTVTATMSHVCDQPWWLTGSPAMWVSCRHQCICKSSSYWLWLNKTWELGTNQPAHNTHKHRHLVLLHQLLLRKSRWLWRGLLFFQSCRLPQALITAVRSTPFLSTLCTVRNYNVGLQSTQATSDHARAHLTWAYDLQNLTKYSK